MGIVDKSLVGRYEPEEIDIFHINDIQKKLIEKYLSDFADMEKIEELEELCKNDIQKNIIKGITRFKINLS